MTHTGTHTSTSTSTSTGHSPPTWEAPDNGVWSLESAHYTTIIPVVLRSEMEAAFAEGFKRTFATLGVPLSHIEVRHINGWPYVSFFLHNVPRSAGKPPPAIVLKALTRLHPAFRKRTKIAAAAIAERRPQRMAEVWAAERNTWIARNLELQRVDADAQSDEELADHLAVVGRHTIAAFQRHFELVPGCIPVGAWLARCAVWGLDPNDARQAVMHSTPVHDEARSRLRSIAAATSGLTPAGLDEIRSHSAEAAAALDDYLAHHGWWATVDSVRGELMNAHPEIILGAIRASHRDEHSDAAADAAEVLARLRTRVPATERSLFDTLAADAHATHKMLDDNSGILGSWPVGIAGELLRAVSRRLVERGRMRSADDIWALTFDDVSALLSGRSRLTPDAIDELATTWRALGELDPPAHLNGEPSPPPDPSVFPPPVAELMTGIGAFLEDKFNDAHHSAGVGRRAVTGRAVVAQSADEAFDRLAPGDILVTTATTPAYNAVLAIVSGLIVTEGGPSCHAAIVARELDLPTIVGLHDATTTIPDGAMIELDPVNVRVTIVNNEPVSA